MSILKKTLLLVVLGGMVVVIGLEGWLWIFNPQPEAPVRRIVLRQEMEGVRGRTEYELNEQGLRALNWEASGKKEGAKRVLFLGGESTDLMMHAAEETWWGRFGERMAEGGAIEVEVACRGSEGGEILRGAKWYHDHVEEMEADVVVVSYGLEDILRGGTDYRYDPNRFLRLGGDTRPAWKRAASDYSQVYRHLRLRRKAKRHEERARLMGKENFVPLLFEEWRRAYARLPYAESIQREAVHDPLLEYLDGIDRLIELCRLTKARLVVLGEPLLHDALLGTDGVLLLRKPIQTGETASDLARPNPGWVNGEANRFYEAAGSRCGERGAFFFSLNGRVPKTGEYFLDDNLLTLKGCERVAELLEPLMRAALAEREGTAGGGKIER